MKFAHALALVGVVLAAGTTASFAADTIGQSIASGKMSTAAAQQLIAGTGLSVDQAKDYTVEQIVKMRWEDN